MIASFTTAMLAIGASAELSLVVKATLALALGLLALRVFRETRAARRCLIIVSTCGVLALLPVAAAFVPPLAIPLREGADATARPVGGVAQAAIVPEREPAKTIAPRAGAVSRGARPPSRRTLLTAAWAIGALISLMPMVFTLRRLRVLRRTGRTWPGGQTRMQELAPPNRLALRATVQLHDDIPAPMTFGLWRPMVLLPADAPGWTDGDIDRALRHELEHVRRADWPAHLFARAVCAVYWFHPLAWMSWRHLHLEADRACDDAVVASGDGSAFAEQLVRMAGRLARRSPRMIPAMAGRGDLSARVMAVLNARQARGRAGVQWSTTAAVVAIASAVALAPLTAVERRSNGAPELQAAMAFQSERFERVSIAPSERAAGRPLNVISVYGDNNTIYATDVSLEALLKFAYGVGPARLVGSATPRPWATIAGLPAWTDRYEIRASTSVRLPEVPADGLGPVHYVVQAMLAERFHLLAHWEPRSRPSYVLTLASGGQLGPSMRRSRTNCTERAAARKEAALKALFRDQPVVPWSESMCGTRSGPARDGVVDLPGTREVIVGAQPMAKFVEVLQQELGREVVNRTGLQGDFDIELRYMQDPAILEERLARQWGRTWQRDARLRDLPPPSPAVDWPALEDALRDQLGLRLEPETVVDDVLVIDRVEKPALD